MNYNNMSVKKKIALGFGVTLVLTLILSVISTAVNLSFKTSVKDISKFSDLQTKANNMVDSLSEARVYATEIILDLIETSYPNYLEKMDSAEGYLAEMRLTVANLNPVYSTILTSLDSDITTWKTTLTKLEEYNKLIIEGKITIYNLRSDIAKNLDALYQSQLADIVSQTDSGALISVTIGRINSAVTILQKFESTNTLNVALVENYDASQSKQLLGAIDDIVKEIELLTSQALSLEDAAFAANIKRSCLKYQTAMREYEKYILDTDIIIADADLFSSQISSSTLNLLSEVNAETSVSVSETLSFANTALILIAAISVVILVLSILSATLLAGSISRPINRICQYLAMIGETGRVLLNTEEAQLLENDANRQDEMGRSAQALKKMLERFVYISGELTTISNGDLTSKVDIISPQDTIGIALKKVTDSLNDMFDDISNSAEMVALASSQIASGAQSLAQGASEQASTVEELSTSIEEISHQTDKSSQLALHTSELSENIKTIAEKGNSQMGEMTLAVREINTASQDIEKVIKVIDDIAFQTNILALNAAVEAARAGQHGKGFAVVADEVRNLAAKSAEAAKDTASLISNTIKKAELGAKISNDTAKSLGEIVSGIEQTSTEMNEITLYSQKQSKAVGQINLAIEQVAHVVHQNSATSEEAAASSQEMNRQSQHLLELVGKFKLRKTKKSADYSTAISYQPFDFGAVVSDNPSTTSFSIDEKY